MTKPDSLLPVYTSALALLPTPMATPACVAIPALAAADAIPAIAPIPANNQIIQTQKKKHTWVSGYAFWK